jgi:hypothetical protein
VFLAKREMAFVRIKSILPALQSSSILWNSSRASFVPVIASSE